MHIDQTLQIKKAAGVDAAIDAFGQVDSAGSTGRNDAVAPNQDPTIFNWRTVQARRRAFRHR